MCWSRKLRVLHLISPISQWGGGDTILLNIVGTKIDKEEDEVALIYDSPKLRKELDKLSVQYHIVQKRVIPVEKSEKKYEIMRMFINIMQVDRLKRVLRDGHYDVIHAHGFSAAWMLWHTHYDKSWCVYTHHDFRQESKAVERLVMTPMYNWFAQCTAVSNCAADSMNRAFPGLKKPFIGIYNSVNETFLRKRTEHEHIIREEGKKYFVQAARLMSRKNQDLVIDAVSKLPEDYKRIVKIVFLGDGPDRERLESLAKELNVENNIIFVGEVNYNEVPEYMDECDFGLFPTEIEGFGLGAAECMIRGLPVLALDNDLMREVVGDGGILVNRDTIADGIIQMIQQGENLRMSAYNQAEKYSPQNMKKAYWRLYNKEVIVSE